MPSYAQCNSSGWCLAGTNSLGDRFFVKKGARLGARVYYTEMMINAQGSKFTGDYVMDCEASMLHSVATQKWSAVLPGTTAEAILSTVCQ